MGKCDPGSWCQLEQTTADDQRAQVDFYQQRSARGSEAQLQLSCRAVTLCGVHVMCGRQWQTCGFCVSVWAGLHWAICHMFGLCVQPLSPCFLGVTCTFVLKGGEPCGVRDAYGRADYMFPVSSCLWEPAPDATRETEKRRARDFLS